MQQFDLGSKFPRLETVADFDFPIGSDEYALVKNGYLSRRKDGLVVLLSLGAYNAFKNRDAKVAVAQAIKKEAKETLPISFEGSLEGLSQSIGPSQTKIGLFTRISIQSSRLRWSLGNVEVLADKDLLSLISQDSCKRQISDAIESLTETSVNIVFTARGSK